MIAATHLLRTVPSRILALDYLRGFFIIIIIVDHLWRWPNLFEYVSGRGELWVSAAEGFVIISGLLVGYVRGYKNRHQPLAVVSKKLIKRGIILYIWMLITTVLLVSASWTLHFKGNIGYVPINQGDWSSLFISVIRLDYVHSLTHFLYLYAIFLILSPLVIWLFRKNKSWLVAIIAILVWGAGIAFSIEWMQWQLLFFVPAIAGFYFESILRFYRGLAVPTKQFVRFGSIAIMAVTVLAAMAIVIPNAPGEYKNSLFGHHPLTGLTVLLSFIWFVGLLSLFQLTLPFLKRWFGWLLLTIGERSLTAYIIHIVPLVLCQLLFSNTDNIWINSLLAVGSIIGTWALMKIPGVNRLIPR
ncbi:MAG: OpgC domain-containing protein [Candidatus Saccharibacteria bacterium]